MDLDDLLLRYFGTIDPGQAAPDAAAAAIERMQVDLGMERDRGRRFALWTLLHLLGQAPDVDATFKASEDRDAARRFMNLADDAAADQAKR